MSKDILWTNIILEEFIRLAALTKEEEIVMRTRVAGWTRTKQALKLHMSMRTLDRIISRLKVKYDLVQPYSPLLPPRKPSVEETYMDTH